MRSSMQNPRLLLTSARSPLKARSACRCLASLASVSPEISSPANNLGQPIHAIRKQLLEGEKKCAQIASEHLDRIRLTEPHVKSFIHLSETVLKEAQEMDLKLERGEKVGPLAGVLVAVKDNLCTVDMPSTGGSRILEGYRPAFDATAVRRLKEAGAIIVGKTNLDEFGMGSTTEGSGFHVTKNPWDITRVPGGSSGGSASAVSARQCMVSLGSDTGGSVRQPASFCGVVGLKPTYGRVSRFGLMAYASSLDVVGLFSNSVEDASLILSVIAGYDTLDSTSSHHEVQDYVSELVQVNQMGSHPLKGLRVGVIKETLGEGVDEAVVSSIKNAASHFEKLGSSVEEVSLPSFDLGLPAYYILASSEASSNLARYDGVRYGQRVGGAGDLSSLYGDSRANGLGHEVKMRILMGTYALSAGYYDAYYKKAQQVRTVVKKSFKDALSKFDILISPAAPSPAYKLGEKTNDPLAMYAGDIMTVNVNLAGLPSLVVPCGLVGEGPARLPVGVQMIGSAFDEARLLRVGQVFEETLEECKFVPTILTKEFV